jgi:hypothetical protein
MNQIAHIFRKDCRRLWQIIAAVLLFTFLHGYGDATMPSAGGVAVGLSPYAIVFILASLSWLILPVLLFLLVVSVIQEESLVGSDKFWLTRPYDRVSLFLEKLLFVVLWAFLPMLLHDIFLIRHFGFSLSSAWGLLLWKSAQFGFFLVVAATVAVLSASFGRAVLIAIVTLVITAFIFFVVLYIPSDSPVGSLTVNYENLAVLALAAAGAVLVVGFQYRFRITSVAAVIAVAAIFACAFLVRFWPASLTPYLLNRYGSPLLQPVQLRPNASLKDIHSLNQIQDPALQARTAYYPFQTVGLSDNVGVNLMGLTAHFASPGQKPASFYLAAATRFQPRAGGQRQFANMGSPDQLISFSAAFAADFDRLKDVDGTLSGNMVLEGFRSSVTRVPMPPPRARQDFAVGGRRCSVESFPRESKVALTFDCVELEPGDTSGFEVGLPRDDSGARSLQCQGQSSTAGSWPAFLSPILRTNYTCEFTPPPAGSDPPGEPAQGQELLVFAEQSLGAMVRTFRIEHFRPAELTLRAWEQRGVLKAESTGTQSTGETAPRTQ